MENGLVKSLLEHSKNFVLIGEAGSGKTETGINLALAMAGLGARVHFFDMDQTKPLFRARGAADVLEAAGVTVHYGEQYMDAPTVAPAVIETLMDPNATVLLDIGGGAYGAHMIGQFSHILDREGTTVFYLVNPYRPWSGSRENIAETMRRVTSASRLTKTCLVANPNLGLGTKTEDILAGMEKLRSLFPGQDFAFVCALEGAAKETETLVGAPVFPLRLYTLPEWLDGSGTRDQTEKEW